MAKNPEVSHLTKEYVEFPVEATHDDVVVDPSAFPVKVALMETGTDPAPGDFFNAEWGFSSNKRVVRFLFGNTDFTVTAPATGSKDYYDVWVNVTTTNEVTKQKVGVLEVF